jgi:hypothetical protein
MSQILPTCIGLVTPYYNMVLVIIVILLFIKLFRTPNKKIFLLPWKFLFIAILIYVIEQILTIIEITKGIIFPPIIFPIFETIIITLFIYMLLIQKEHISKS